MTVQFEWPGGLVERLTNEVRQRGMSLDQYVLKSVLHQNESDGTPADQIEKRRKREQAAARILEIRKRVKPDPED